MIPSEAEIKGASMVGSVVVESCGHMRSTSASSSNSFDSCSDLLGSLDLSLKDSTHSEMPPELQQQEKSFTKASHSVEEKVYSKSERHGLEHLQIGSGDLVSCKVEEKLLKAEVCNFVEEDAEIIKPVNVNEFAVLTNQTLPNCSQPQLSSPFISNYKSPLESRKGKSFGLEPVDDGEECSNRGTESALGKLGIDFDNDGDITGDMKAFPPRKDDGSAVFLQCRNLNTGGTSTENLNDFHIRQSLNSESEKVAVMPGKITDIMGKADVHSNLLLGDSKVLTDRTDTFTNDTSIDDDVSHFHIKEEQDRGPVAIGNLLYPYANQLKIQASEQFSYGQAASQIQEQSGFLSRYEDDDNRQGAHSNLESKKEVKKPFVASSNVESREWDGAEFMNETSEEEGHAADQSSLGTNTYILGELIGRPGNAIQCHSCTPGPDDRVSFSESDCDLQQLEDSIKFFDLHRLNSVVPLPLGSLSAGSSGHHTQKVDEHVDLNEFVCRDGSQPWTSSNQDQEHPISSSPSLGESRVPSDVSTNFLGKEVRSTDVLSGLESEVARVDDEVNKKKVAEFQSYGNEIRLESKPQWLLKDLPGTSLDKGKLKGLSLQIESKKAAGLDKEDLGPDELSRYMEALDVNETYLDTVVKMEDVLLTSDETSNRTKLETAGISMIGTPRPSRDGTLCSSTSGIQTFSSHYSLSGEGIPFTVDWVEVVGAKQQKGGSSLGERMVGVKDHTVYCIKVISGKQSWEVLRRYRDFIGLYNQLKRIFNSQTERCLPPPWEKVEHESRKVFGNTSPNVIVVRSICIESCLQSLLQAGVPFSTTPPLFWFLRPKGVSRMLHPEDQLSIHASSSQNHSHFQLGALDSPQLQSPQSDTGSSRMEQDHDRNAFILGKTVNLVVKIHPKKSLKQLLHSQYYSCAGCYKHLDLEKGLVHGFVQSLPWGKPRFCEYSGQIFCGSCHQNDFAVLPARVLQQWNFMPRRVSKLAKAYLDSIYDQPMLCVSAANSHLYTRVPILLHIKETRRALNRMLSCIHCLLRTRLQQTLGSRWYLLENSDFFALRDLEDLSKGAFAVLPGLLTAVSKNLKLHITKQCSVCRETGEWCGAGILCDDPFSPIFPFQVDNVAHCKICHAPFHKNCFEKCTACPSCSKDRSNKMIDAAESIGAFKT